VRRGGPAARRDLAGAEGVARGEEVASDGRESLDLPRYGLGLGQLLLQRRLLAARSSGRRRRARVRVHLYVFQRNALPVDGRLPQVEAQPDNGRVCAP
jgi:hypothetical protein